MASGEWRVASGEWRVASGEWRVASGEWRENSGHWTVKTKGRDITPHASRPATLALCRRPKNGFARLPDSALIRPELQCVND